MFYNFFFSFVLFIYILYIRHDLRHDYGTLTVCNKFRSYTTEQIGPFLTRLLKRIVVSSSAESCFRLSRTSSDGATDTKLHELKSTCYSPVFGRRYILL